MNYRTLGKTGFKISEISLGTWQLSDEWSKDLDRTHAKKLLHTAIDRGVNFLDTADVYGDGKSESIVAETVKERDERVYVATKCGRKITPHVSEQYTPSALRNYVEDSLRNMGLECLDLIQLHCPPTEVYYRPEIFELFNDLKKEGKIKYLGVSVEKVEEALKAIEFENVSTVQIIFNIFRQRPADLFFEQASKRDIGIIVRVPLASGLLTGKFSESSTFKKSDHRNFNREGKAFDKGETFAGIDFETGLEATRQLKALFPDHDNLAPVALKWITQHEEVSTVIPGASSVDHVISNCSAYQVPKIDASTWQRIDDLYNKKIKPEVHHRW